MNVQRIESFVAREILRPNSSLPWPTLPNPLLPAYVANPRGKGDKPSTVVLFVSRETVVWYTSTTSDGRHVTLPYMQPVRSEGALDQEEWFVRHARRTITKYPPIHKLRPGEPITLSWF